MIAKKSDKKKGIPVINNERERERQTERERERGVV